MLVLTNFFEKSSFKKKASLGNFFKQKFQKKHIVQLGLDMCELGVSNVIGKQEHEGEKS